MHSIEKKYRLGSYLYVSHTLSTWNARLFEFGIILFLADLWRETLLPVSLFILLSVTPGSLLAPAIGRYIDRSQRLHVVRCSILAQRLAVVLSCGILLCPILISYRMTCIITLGVLGAIENMSSLMNTVSVERDWVVVVAGDDINWLRVLNARMRSIDLTCKLVGPLLIGLIEDLSTRGAIIFVLSSSACSVVIEYWTIAHVYRSVPELSFKPDNQSESLLDLSPVSYWKHPVVLPSLALTALYITVLSFSGAMITYLLDSGLDTRQVTLLRTASVFIELSATLIVPWTTGHIGAMWAGLLFIDYQWLVLLVSGFIFWEFSSSMSLAIGVMLSRLGLWGFDLSAQAIIQDGVSESQRGRFSMMEKGLQNLCMVVASLSTLIWNKPSQFKYPVAMSICAVGAGVLLYSTWVWQTKRASVRLP